MVDTLSSGSEGKSLLLLKTVEASESASTMNRVSAAKDSSITKRDAAEAAAAAAASSTRSRVPKIVVVDSVVDSSSLSTCHSSSHPKDTVTRSSTENESKRRGKKNRRKHHHQDTKNGGDSVLTEGQQQQQQKQQQRRGEEERLEAAAISCEPRLGESGWTKSGLATARKLLDEKQQVAMERADISPSYTSDEWEEADDSANSSDDTDDDDHTDSSDDDDPKSQVDRLIERGTLMYMEGENSALSSEDESDDDDSSSDDDYDSESDITDVSPLVSATASPLGLSPVLPRRTTIPTSPLALHDNRDLNFRYDPRQSPFNWDGPHLHTLPNFNTAGRLLTDEEEAHPAVGIHHQDSTNMDLLLQAVIELENKNNMEQFNNLNHQRKLSSSGLPNHSNDQRIIHPIRDNPHHLHLRKMYPRRKNMSFSNEEVRKIDRDNKILLKKIMAAHTRTKPSLTSPNQATSNRSFQKPSNASTNSRKKEDRIRRENLILLKKIQEAKPSKELVSPIGGGGMNPILSSSPSAGVANRSSSSSNIRSPPPPTSSCGAFMRSIVQPPHVGVPPPRKETAL